jgi:hypothetical protein
MENTSAGDQPPPTNLAAFGEVPRRHFGSTNVVVSALALGGYSFAMAKSKKEALRIVQEAVDMVLAWKFSACGLGFQRFFRIPQSGCHPIVRRFGPRNVKSLGPPLNGDQGHRSEANHQPSNYNEHTTSKRKLEHCQRQT